MEIKLDTKDRKILSELDMGARQPLSSIAKKVKLSREVVNYRIKQLEKRGIIEGYYTALDTSKLGLMYCRLWLKYRQMSNEKEKQLLDFCRNSGKVIWVTLSQGKWDFNIVYLAKSIDEVEEFYDALHGNFGNYLQNVDFSIATKVYHFKNKFLYPSNDFREAVLGDKPKKNIKTDETDYKIIQLISANARASLLEIANKLGTTPKSVNYRLKKLQDEKVIIGFRAIINTKMLGYDYFKVFLNLQNFTGENIAKIMYYLKHNQNVVFITKALGYYNLEFEAILKNANQLNNILRELRLKFHDMLLDYEIVLDYATPVSTNFPKYISTK